MHSRQSERLHASYRWYWFGVRSALFSCPDSKHEALWCHNCYFRQCEYEKQEDLSPLVIMLAHQSAPAGKLRPLSLTSEPLTRYKVWSKTLREAETSKPNTCTHRLGFPCLNTGLLLWMKKRPWGLGYQVSWFQGFLALMRWPSSVYCIPISCLLLSAALPHRLRS